MNQREAMERFGVKSTSTWADLVRAGLPRSPRGRGYTYDEDELAAWFAERDDDPVDADVQELYRRERAKKTKAERELRELKLAEERGELVRSDQVTKTWSEHIVRARARLLRLPAELAAPAFAASTELEVEELLRAGVRAALEELADD